MTIPKKGSRLITVNGDRYRWRASQTSPYYLSIVAQKADNPGTKIVVQISPEYLWNKNGVLAVFPSDVKSCIEKALLVGWQPSTPGTPFEFSYFPSPSLV